MTFFWCTFGLETVSVAHLIPITAIFLTIDAEYWFVLMLQFDKEMVRFGATSERKCKSKYGDLCVNPIICVACPASLFYGFQTNDSILWESTSWSYALMKWVWLNCDSEVIIIYIRFSMGLINQIEIRFRIFSKPTASRDFVSGASPKYILYSTDNLCWCSFTADSYSKIVPIFDLSTV